MKKWVVMAKKADFNAISEACGISPVLARLIRNRDVCGEGETESFLRGTLQDLYSPSLLPDAEKAAAILSDGIDRGRRIRVIGDYDVDGICASYIFYSVLSACGALVDVVLPERRRDGYGMNVRMVEEAAQEGVEILLTCDNGISALTPVREAATQGLTVIITDHHEIPFTVDAGGKRMYQPPEADAVVDPKIVDPLTEAPYYPFPEICGAVVAFKVSQLLLDRRQSGSSHGLLQSMLPFCALATVCDVMPLLKENRILVREGLSEAARTQNAGLRALQKATGLWGIPLTCYHAGFILGPCLNASGRLGSARRAVELFMEEDEDKALLIAEELKELNDRRKSMTIEQTEAAENAMERGGIPQEKVLVIYLPGCHESLVGIIAGRIKEKYNRPAFVLTDADEIMLKGSGRSVEAYDMYEAMNRCSDLFDKFGGHKMAGGLTIRRDRFEELCTRLNADCSLTPDDLQEVVRIDMELPPRLLNLSLVKEFSLLEPCGTANPRPLFVTRGVRLAGARVLGQNRNVVKLRGIDSAGTSLELIRFEDAEVFAAQAAGGSQTLAWRDLLSGCGTVVIDMVYYPEINCWNGRESLQFIITDYRTKQDATEKTGK